MWECEKERANQSGEGGGTDTFLSSAKTYFQPIRICEANSGAYPYCVTDILYGGRRRIEVKHCQPINVWVFFFFSTGGRWERVRVAFNLLLVIFFSFLLLLPNTFLWGMMCVSSTSTAARRNLGRTPGCRCCSSYWSSRPLAVTAAERLAATPSSADWSSGVVLNPVG